MTTKQTPAPLVKSFSFDFAVKAPTLDAALAAIAEAAAYLAATKAASPPAGSPVDDWEWTDETDYQVRFGDAIRKYERPGASEGTPLTPEYWEPLAHTFVSAWYEMEVALEDKFRDSVAWDVANAIAAAYWPGDFAAEAVKEVIAVLENGGAEDDDAV